MKSFKTPFILIFLFVNSFSGFSQTQSLWSEIRKSNADSVGLSALQYQVPLCLNEFTFFEHNMLKGNNDAVYIHGWLNRDFNNDGFADIFLGFAAMGEIEPVPFMLLIYDKNTGTYKDQSYRIKLNLGQSWNRKSMAADFNGDGILDIVAVSHPECVTCNLSYFDILLSNSDTTWTQKRLKVVDRFKGEGYYHGVAVGDIDNDGDIDIVLGNENSNKDGIYSMINEGNGDFKETQAVPFKVGNSMTTFAWTVELADINKDGCLDLFYWDNEINNGILYGNGNGTFGQSYQYFGSLKYPYIMDYILRDLDGDGDLDFILNTTDYKTGWQLVVRENKEIDGDGKIIWIDHTEAITQSLKEQGFYPDGDNGMFYLQAVDINQNGELDIIPRAPLTNQGTYLTFGWKSWILLGNGAWKFEYKTIPYAEPPKSIISTITNGKVNLKWERVKQNYSNSDGEISKWAIYISDKSWGDRSQVGNPLIVSSKDTKSETGFDQFILDPSSKEMFIRISPIDSSGVEWTLSNMLKITFPPPSISSATICDENTLTISGTNFIGVNEVTVGGFAVSSYAILSETTIQAELNNSQSGSISVTTVVGNATFSNVTNIISPSGTFKINGKKSPFSRTIESYSVPETNGVNFIWSFPEGWEQISGENTNVVTVKVGTSDGIITVVPSALCGSLETISLQATVYTYIPDDNFQKTLHELGIDNENKPDSVRTSSLFNILTLNLDTKSINDLTGIQDFESLLTLECRNNPLKVLDISKNYHLEKLICNNNLLASLDISKNKVLKSLDCNGNLIESLDLSQNKLLEELICDNNPITSLDVTNNKNLSLLSIYNQDISSIDLSNNNMLSYFSCSNCQLSYLDVSKNFNLTLLNFSSNQLKSVDLSNNTKLNLLYCRDNQLTKLDLSEMKELNDLDCKDNQIISLDLSKNTALTNVLCNNNMLTSLNVKNGNNQNIQTMHTNNNPNLTCINVDDPEKAATYPDWTKDATASYSDNCVKTNIGLTELEKSIKIYPNPITDELIIENMSGSINNDFEIINAFGQSVLHGKFNEKTIIKTDILTPGIYVVRLKSGDMFKFEKVVKQ